MTTATRSHELPPRTAAVLVHALGEKALRPGTRTHQRTSDAVARCLARYRNAFGGEPLPAELEELLDARIAAEIMKAYESTDDPSFVLRRIERNLTLARQNDGLYEQIKAGMRAHAEQLPTTFDLSDLGYEPIDVEREDW